MRWSIARQCRWHLPLSSNVVPRNLSCILFCSKELKVHKVDCHSRGLLPGGIYFLFYFVKFFTLSKNAITVYSVHYDDAPNGKRPPSRTVRRVHVMPWATPIRRIGQTLSGSVTDEDGPALMVGYRYCMIGIHRT